MCIDYAQCGLGGASCGTRPLNKYLLRPEPVTFSFTLRPYEPTIGPLAEALRLATGRSDTLEDLLTHGERSFNLKRLINVDRGISRKDDILPKRFLTVPKTGEGYTPNLPPLESMLDEYYEARGWSRDGIPLAATRDRLELP